MGHRLGGQIAGNGADFAVSLAEFLQSVLDQVRGLWRE